ncbi:hypothetical protein BC939DRAFT_467187 [Gamsiella multidivaricata]|uniref:uncharacterized protein n=1 Tax=Gamsiella multidivaricata TaxID=101098 RepID=UPI002220EFD4|nr:uncharacterized protein BC939DRAFT_467187 [Gamsiella multidivaricata]KAI7817029.1 hypothetical protein BC939DRAFT_467187 [Gamsiella multidivaricata]
MTPRVLHLVTQRHTPTLVMHYPLLLHVQHASAPLLLLMSIVCWGLLLSPYGAAHWRAASYICTIFYTVVLLSVPTSCSCVLLERQDGNTDV